ncbi:MAG: YmdB family metallophosphoesterase [Actinomycetota bacterium]|nr:YmdB family metallophosphoesterase [Actinomycetota bacterium]
MGEDGVRRRRGRQGGGGPRTHTHEPTVNLHVLPGGTALVVDVGMTGPSGSLGGSPLEHFAAKLKGEDPSSLAPFELAAGPMTLGAV